MGILDQDYPSVNDFAPSWADVGLTIIPLEGTQLETVDFAGIKWSRKVEVGEQRGPGGRIRKRTAGQGSQEASATFYKSGARRLLQLLMENAPERGNQLLISLVTFDILVQHTPIGETEIYETKLKGCRYLGDGHDLKEGNEADKVEITLNPIEIVDLVDGMEVLLI